MTYEKNDKLTICAECKHRWEGSATGRSQCAATETRKINFVTGATWSETEDCCETNTDGHCPHYSLACEVPHKPAKQVFDKP